MMWLKNLIRRWLGFVPYRSEGGLTAIADSDNSRLEGAPLCRVSIMPAVNGKILVLSTYKPNPHGSDWTHTNHLLLDGDNIGDAVTTLLVRQTLTK